MTVEYAINLYEGMKALKERVSIFEGLSDFYCKDIKTQYASGAVPGMTAEPDIPKDLLIRARAINIHRSPLCGRNFEYYSEDPFL